MQRLVAGIVIFGLALAGCGDDTSPDNGSPPATVAPSSTAPSVDEAAADSFAVTVEGIEPDGEIPVAHTCDGDDSPPVISVSSPPEGTVGYALVVTDPDAPTAAPFVHYVGHGIEADGDGALDLASATEGINDFGRPGWGGPCPPEGGAAHEYAFELYALSAAPVAEADLALAEVRPLLADLTLGLAQFSAYYGR